MKIAILFEGSPTKPGGFYQSLQSASILNQIVDDRFDLEFVCLEKKTFDLLKKDNFKVKLFKNNFKKKLFNLFKNFQFFKNLIINYEIEHPFSQFLTNNNYDLVIFLSPSALSYYCGKTNFIINIWDLDHKRNSPHPEHRINYNFIKREELINYSIFHSIKVIVPENKTRDELIKIYSCDEKNIVTQPFIPYLPKIYENNNLNVSFPNIFEKLNIPKKKIILYPATFWPHKNHQYLIEVAKILKQEKKEDYLFVFCGADNGNLKFIKEEIKKFNLEDFFKIFSLVSDVQLISLYLNSYAVTMPTTGGPTNLPLYESFFFKKIIFYNKYLLEEEDLIKNTIPIDINNPNDFYHKLSILEKKDIDLITLNASKLYKKKCSFENFKKTYLKIIEDFLFSRKSWK